MALKTHAHSWLAGLLFISSAGSLQATTIVLDFDTASKFDAFGQETGTFNASPFGFTGMSNSQIQQAILTRVGDHFHAYPSVVDDINSPLPVDMELDIDFEIGFYGSAPVNGDAEYYMMSVGTGLSGSNATNAGIYGAACLSCVRDPAGNANIYNIPMGTGIGSIWTDHITSSAYLASSNQDLVNLIAGTISHEIAHSLSLEHAGAQSPNPGDSAWGVMGSGATSMPNSQRILNREFTYTNMANLITSVGLRAAADTTSQVGQPATWLLLLAALLGLRGSRMAHVASGKTRPSIHPSPLAA